MCAPLSPYMLPSPGMCRRSRHPHYRGATARDILTTAAPLLETSSQQGGRHSIHPHNRGAAARDILTTAAPPLKTSSQPQRRRRRGGCLYKFVGSQSDPSRRRRRRDTLSLSSAHGPQGQNLTREWRVNRCEEGLALGRGTIAITIIRSRFGTPASADAGAGRRARPSRPGGERSRMPRGVASLIRVRGPNGHSLPLGAWPKWDSVERILVVVVVCCCLLFVVVVVPAPRPTLISRSWTARPVCLLLSSSPPRDPP